MIDLPKAREMRRLRPHSGGQRDVYETVQHLIRSWCDGVTFAAFPGRRLFEISVPSGFAVSIMSSCHIRHP
jgi:hypothetical protein